MINIFENLGLVDNTNAMTSMQVRELGTILPEQDTISVLEFGAGHTTTKLHQALLTKYKHVNYVTYEDNPEWAPTDERIEVRMFNREDLINGDIKIPPNEKYDLIIVDGPDGELRKYWYSVFKNNVNAGTIIHVDDVFHYESFELELNNSFPRIEYIFEVGRNGWLPPNKCWITAKVK